MIQMLITAETPFWECKNNEEIMTDLQLSQKNKL
jgi:hypothetical protein